MPVLWRSAFQAHRPHIALPSTSCPVTVATLRSAFQALNTYASALLRIIAKSLTVFQALDTYASALLRVIAKSLTVFQTGRCANFIAMSIKCLEGTTERSDGNRGRSPRIDEARTMCLEGTTPQDMQFKHRHWRTASSLRFS